MGPLQNKNSSFVDELGKVEKKALTFGIEAGSKKFRQYLLLLFFLTVLQFGAHSRHIF